MIVGHGDNRYSYGALMHYDFSSNVPYRNHADEIISHPSGRLESLSHYPDPQAKELRELSAKHWRLDPDWLLVTGGSTEASYLLAHLFASDETLITVPSFAGYEGACQLCRHRLSYIPTSAIASQSTPTDLLWSVLPSNPDGDISHRVALLNYCTAHPDSYVIVDEAYAELCTESVTLLDEVVHHPNLILVRSLTKSFALPGMRLGYITAHPPLLARLEPLRSSWSVNALALEAGAYICQHYDRLPSDATGLVWEAQHLAYEAAQIVGISLIPSPTPYPLACLDEGRGTVTQLKEYLVKQHGVLVRDAANFRSLSPCHFRLSVQSPEAGQALLRGLSSYL